MPGHKHHYCNRTKFVTHEILWITKSISHVQCIFQEKYDLAWAFNRQKGVIWNSYPAVDSQRLHYTFLRPAFLLRAIKSLVVWGTAHSYLRNVIAVAPRWHLSDMNVWFIWSKGYVCISLWKPMMTSSKWNGNIFHVTGPSWGESTGHQWIPHKDQWRGALMFSLICAWINGWANNQDAGETQSRSLWCHCYVENIKKVDSITQCFVRFRFLSWIISDTDSGKLCARNGSNETPSNHENAKSI